MNIGRERRGGRDREGSEREGRKAEWEGREMVKGRKEEEREGYSLQGRAFARRFLNLLASSFASVNSRTFTRNCRRR